MTQIWTAIKEATISREVQLQTRLALQDVMNGQKHQSTADQANKSVNNADGLDEAGPAELGSVEGYEDTGHELGGGCEKDEREEGECKADEGQHEEDEMDSEEDEVDHEEHHDEYVKNRVNNKRPSAHPRSSSSQPDQNPSDNNPAPGGEYSSGPHQLQRHIREMWTDSDNEEVSGDLMESDENSGELPSPLTPSDTHNTPDTATPIDRSGPLDALDSPNTVQHHETRSSNPAPAPSINGVPRNFFIGIIRHTMRVPFTHESSIDEYKQNRDHMDASHFRHLGELSRVSKDWRGWITQTPQLWNTIIPSRSIHQIPIWIKHSGQRSLRIKIDYANFSSEPEARMAEESSWISALEVHARRWHAIEFKNTPDTFHLVHKWLFVPAPTIRHLLLHDLSSYHQKTKPYKSVMLGGLIMKPYRLTLTHLSISMARFDPSELTHINLDNTLCPLNDVVTLLKTAVALEVLRLSYVSLPPGSMIAPKVQERLNDQERWTVPKGVRFELQKLHDMELDMEWSQAKAIISA